MFTGTAIKLSRKAPNSPCKRQHVVALHVNLDKMAELSRETFAA
jgi:hypothetical protein